MKKLAFLFFAVLILASCEEQNLDYSTEFQSEQGEKSYAVSDENTVESAVPENTGIRITDLGIPLENRYETDSRSIIPGDIAVSEGKLFVGGGDSNNNTGPVEMWAYDIPQKEWILSGTLPDEEINRFLFINGVLTVPGTDPKADWSAGNYYTYENGEWMVYRVLPPSSHCFDMVENDGIIIAAIDSTSGYYRAAVSDNGGKSFYTVPFIKDGEEIANPNGFHYYDLYNISGEIFTELSHHGLFRFNGERFVYAGESISHRFGGAFGYSEVTYGGEAISEGVLYLARGNVYAVKDAEDIQCVQHSFKGTFCDIYSFDGMLYYLCVTKEDGYFVNSVYINESNADDGYELVTQFYYESPASCLAVEGNRFYFAICSKKLNDKNRGRIIEIEKLD